MSKYLIKSKRFCKKYTKSDENKFLNDERIVKFPISLPGYYDFFENYAKKNYTFEETKCLCKNNNDLIVSEHDRHLVEFQTVICQSCGLIRAKKYYSKENIIDFYENHYRKIMSKNVKPIEPAKYFDKNYKAKKYQHDLIDKYIDHNQKNLKILDLGGSIGGTLKHFDYNNNELFLSDYYDPYLNFAKKINIKAIKGELKDIDFKPDIIILSHVIEHWNDLEDQIEELIRIQKINKTLNYIEFPGIDSLKLGRRNGDLLGDLHVPHIYYFHTKVFENLMNRFGFEKIYMDREIKSIFIYTGKKEPLENFFENVKRDLLKAENKRKKIIFRRFVKLFLPNILIKLLRKIKTNNIDFLF